MFNELRWLIFEVKAKFRPKFEKMMDLLNKIVGWQGGLVRGGYP
jgi:hypothetical protein